MPLAPATPTGHDELAELVHGRCDAPFLDQLRSALSADDASITPDPAGRGDHVRRRLHGLAVGLPTARELLRTPERLAALHAWTAVAEPALCMTAVNHYLLCLGSMAQLAPDHEALKDQFTALESGRAKGAYLITEVGRANSHLATRTLAEFDPHTREFVLHTPDPGAAKFSGVGALGLPQTAVALARLVVAGTDRGVFGFVVDLGDEHGLLPGVEVSSVLELGALPLDYAQVRFHHVRLPFERWLRDSAGIRDDGSFHDPLGSTDLRLRRTLCVGQTLWGALPAAAAALARQSAVLALRYARGRRSQGRLAPGAPLLTYRTQQYAVLGAFADAFALTCAADRARAAWAACLAPGAEGDGGTDGMAFGPWAAVSRPLAGYKAHTVRAAARIVADCRSHCGFSGHLDVNRLAAYQGFLDAFDTAGGDSRLIFFDLGRARCEEAEPDHPDAPPADPEPGPGWWPAVARAHERRLAALLRRRVGGPGHDDLGTWNPLLAQAGELGEVQAARLAADDVRDTVAAVRDPALRDLLGALATLHGLRDAQRWAGSLLTAGTLQPQQVRALPPHVDRLCDALLPRLPLLEQAFAYPQRIVRAPLGAADYNHALADSLSWSHGGRT